MAAVATESPTPEDFLKDVWPEAGFHCLSSVSGSARGMDHHWVQSPAEARKVAATLCEANRDVYFAMSGFTEQRRLQAAVESVRAFWSDIDVGPDKPYATIVEAIKALKDWCAETGFPLPTWIVCSGSGLHLYWVLTNAIPAERWLAVARRLKSYMQATNLRVDPSRAADSASVLRVPGTMNFKDPANPQEVFIAAPPTRRFALEEIEAHLPLLGPQAVGAPKSESSWTAGMEREFPPADAEQIRAGCRQMAHAYEIQCNDIEEPYWRAVLSVLWRCEGGEDLIHEWSKGDPRYDPRETRAKAEGTQGPHTCEQFASCNPGGCEGCPLRGKITSPVLIGTQPPEPEVREGDVAPDERINQVGDFLVSASGVYVSSMNEETGQEERKRITTCPLWVVENRERARAEDEPDMSSLVLQWHSLDGRSRKAVIYQSQAHEERTFKAWLSDHNIFPMVRNTKVLQSYIAAVTEELIRQGRVFTYYDRLGWFDGEFVMAGHKVSEAGIEPVRVQSTTNIASHAPAPEADIDQWVEGVKVLNRAGLEYHRFALLAGFASPLLELAGWTSPVLSLAGPSGTGKTTAGLLAASLYGSPEHLIMASTATQNAIGVQAAALKSIPLLIDEISRWRAMMTANVSYELPNGEGKAALNQNRTMQRPPRWALVPIFTTNRPISDFSMADFDEAVRRRILELSFDREHALTQDEAETLHRTMKRHHGVAGLAYMHKVVTMRESIAGLLKSTEQMLSQSVNLEAADRFHRWLLAAALVGGMIARAAGLIHFDPKETVMAVAHRVEQDNAEMESDEERLVNVLAEFLVEHRHRTMWWVMNERGKEDLPTVDAEREPLARYDKESGLMYVSATKLRQHLLAERVSLANLSGWLAENGVIEKKMRLYPGQARGINCLVWPMEKLGIDVEEQNVNS